MAVTAAGGLRARVKGVLVALERGRPDLYRLLRFGAVSAVVTPTTLLILWGLHALAGWAAWQANLAAVSAGAVPGYVLNRYWVWGRSGRNRLWGEVLPFWSITLAGGVASTLAVNAAAGRWDHSGLLVVVNLGTYGVMWLLKFVILDRLLWPAARRRSQSPGDDRSRSQDSTPQPDQQPAGVRGS